MTDVCRFSIKFGKTNSKIAEIFEICDNYLILFNIIQSCPYLPSGAGPRAGAGPPSGAGPRVGAGPPRSGGAGPSGGGPPRSVALARGPQLACVIEYLSVEVLITGRKEKIGIDDVTE